MPVHIGRVEPYRAVCREHIQYAPALVFLDPGGKVRYYFTILFFRYRKLGIAVKYVYLFYLITPE